MGLSKSDFSKVSTIIIPKLSSLKWENGSTSTLMIDYPTRNVHHVPIQTSGGFLLSKRLMPSLMAPMPKSIVAIRVGQ